MFNQLKEFVKVHFNLNIQIPINLNYKCNTISSPVEHNDKTNYLSFNLEKISPENLIILQEITKASVNEGAVLLDRESSELANDVKLKEESSDIKSLLEFFMNKIPQDDHSALRSAIYIKKRAQEGAGYEEIFRLKGDVGRKYWGRGLTICNLYASGYFETMIKPLYEELKERGVEKDFINKYNIIINEEAFAIFVSGHMDSGQVKSDIKMKIDRNLRYGIKTVSIHGIGRINKDKIREAIFEIQKDDYPNIETSIEETGNIILAKLAFR